MLKKSINGTNELRVTKQIAQLFHIFTWYRPLATSLQQIKYLCKAATCKEQASTFGEPNHKPRKAHCFLACSGISFTNISTGTPFSSWGLKLNNGGRKRPFGSRVLGSRSSSKKGWIKASNAVLRRLGEYCSSLETRSTASGGIRLWNILCHGWALIWGNLNSV